jgi:hypothetical protein
MTAGLGDFRYSCECAVVDPDLEGLLSYEDSFVLLPPDGFQVIGGAPTFAAMRPSPSWLKCGLIGAAD